MPPPIRLMIAGLPRCGTTLLASLLNQQKGCRFVTDYVSWFRDACERLEVEWNEPLTLAQRRVCLALARDSWIRLRHPVLVTTEQFSTIDELHQAIAGELVREGTRAVGHKALLSPEQIEVARQRTKIHLIIMARDPRAAVLSYWHRTGEGVEAYVDNWKKTVRYASDARRGVTLLRFEDLVERTEATLGKITQLWGEQPTLPTKLSFDDGPSSVDWKENSAFGDVVEPFDRTPLARWKESAESPIVRYADAVCRGEMGRLGYEPLSDHSTRSRMRHQIHAAVWDLDRRVDTAWRRLRVRVRERLAPPLTHG